jgi:hypothetical protein
VSVICVSEWFIWQLLDYTFEDKSEFAMEQKLSDKKTEFSANFDKLLTSGKSFQKIFFAVPETNQIITKMNVNYFMEGVELMTHSGFKLTDMESSLIENSLIILQSANKFRDIFFLGRIETSGAEFYYIAFGYSKDILKDRKFFYSLNAYEWLMMPDLKPKLLQVALKVTSYFQGDPAHVERVSVVSDVWLCKFCNFHVISF